MAVNPGPDANNNIAGSTQHAPSQQQYQQQAPQPAAAPQQPFGGNQGFASAQSRLMNPMARASAGEAVHRYMDAFKKIITAEGGLGDSVRLLILDGSIRGSALSSILLCRRAGDSVMVHNMIIEASAQRLNNTEISIGAQKVEIPTVAGDVNNEGFWMKIQAVVREAYGSITPVYAGAVVVPRELEPEDAFHIRTVLYYADTAVWTTIQSNTVNAPEPFSVTWATRSDKLAARLDFAPQNVETAAGLPVRSDVSVILTASSGASNDPLQANNQDFSRVDGYIDLVYAPPAPPAMGQVQQTQHYVPRFVMTACAPQLNAITMELMLLSISSATLLYRNMLWANVFRPRYGAGLNLRDIGAIGLDVPMLSGEPAGKKIDTQSPTFGPDALYSLVRAAVRSDMVYSFDVEECGDQSWLQLAFVSSANGDQDAHRMLIQAADNLTGGQFSQHFAGGPLFVDDNNRILLGHYVDGTTNQREDVRKIDYLAMLNYVGGTDMQAVVDYANTFDQTNIDLPLRLEKRIKILEKVCGDTLRITGYARRVTLTPAFIDALAKSVVAAGLNIQPQNTFADFGNNVRRGNEFITDLAYGGQGAMQLFAHSQGGTRAASMPAQVKWR